MWKDSTHGGSKHDDDSAIGDSAGEESSHSAQMRKSSEVDEDPLMKMNEKLGIEMPHCLLPSNDRKTTTRSFTASETNNKSGGADGYKMKNNMESKLDYLLTEMSKLRQIDQDLLYKFTHINRNVEEIKYLMEERVADIQNNMQEYQSTNNINGVHSSTTPRQSTTQLSPNTMIEVDNNQAAYVVPINSKVPLAYAVTKRVTDENTKFVAVSPPASPPQPPPPSSTTTTVPTPPRQRGHQHTASSSSSSSMVSDDSMSCFVRSCDDDDAVKVSSHLPHHQQEHQQQIWVRNTNLITASAYKQPPTSQTCYSTSKSYPKTNSETATSNTNGTSTVDDDDDDYLLLHSSSGKTRSNSSSLKLYRGNNGNNYHSNNQNSSSSSSNHHHRHSNVTSVPSFHTNHHDNNNKNLWKSRTMSNPPPSNWRNLVLSRSNTTSSSAASKFSMQLSSRLAKFGNNIGAFKRSSSKSSSSSTSKSVTSGDSTTSTSSSSIVSRWHKLTRKTSDLSNRPPPPPPQQQQVVNTTNYITNTTTRYNITDDDDVTYL